MQYVLLVCDDETPAPSREELSGDPMVQSWEAGLDRRGAEQFGTRLRPSGHATTGLGPSSGQTRSR